MKKVHWATGIIFGISIMAVLLFSGMEIAIYSNVDVYEKEYKKYDVPSALDMTMEDTMYVTEEILSYLRGDRDKLTAVTYVEGEKQEFFNSQDRFHMAEVKELFLGGMRIRFIGCIAAAVCVILLFVMKAEVKRILSRSYQMVLAASGVAAAVIGLAAAVNFTRVFEIFHQIFFDNDLWLFDPDEDYMIRLFPEAFLLIW